MRIFEIVFLSLNLPVLLLCLSGRPLSPLFRLLPMFALLAMTIHLVVEGYRWQMSPGYLATACIFIACTWLRTLESGTWIGVISLALLFGSAAAGILVPVFRFPTPTGPYPVGTVIHHFVDHSRREERSVAPDARRELMVQVWYPAEHPGRGLPYRKRFETSLKGAYLTLVRTHAIANASIAGAFSHYPVLIFCPSWIGRRNQNTFQVEELASNGFIVAGIDHPYSTDLTVFPDGRAVRTGLGDFLDYSSDSAFETTLNNVSRQLHIRTADARFVLGQLALLNKTDPTGLLTGRLDMARAGILGHSIGGSVAVEACRLDSRFKAGINMDGLIFGESADAGVAQPFLFMNDDEPIPASEDILRLQGPGLRRWTMIGRCIRGVRLSISKGRGHCISIQGASHMNFCDSPFYTPVRQLSGAGRIDTHRAAQIINDYAVAFFQRYLNSRDNGLLDGPSPRYPEVRFHGLSDLPQ